MALLFSRQSKGISYQVRTAGNSLRLYTNGAFHTQFNPNYLFTGGVWDLLSLPSWCMNTSPAKVLVLGVAGGTVIHQLNSMHPPDSIIGVELDSMHIEIARKYFHLDYRNLELVKADAKEWLESNNAKFDYIVDDIFLHAEGDPKRPFGLDEDWFRLLSRHLASGGTLVQNHVDHGHARRAARYFKSGTVLAFSTEQYENIVLAWFTSGNARSLKQNLKTRLISLPRMITRRLRHNCRTLRG